MPPKDLSDQLKMAVTDLEQEIAVLRHMEKVRGELKDGQRLIRLWDE